MSDTAPAKPSTGDRLAKVIARSGLCSRRDAEVWITEGRVVVNGKKVNEGKNGQLKKGRIALQSEGAEIHFKDIRIKSLN